MNISATARKGHGKARRAGSGSAVEAGGRAGFVARGVIYILVGVLALRIAFTDGNGGGGSKKQADRGGALSEIAQKPFGSVLLWILGIALVGMALWRLSEAAFGASGPDGDKATKRLASAGRAVFYGFVSYSVLTFAAGSKSSGSGSSDSQSQDVTAKVLDLPGGRWLVGIAGVAIAGIGLYIAARPRCVSSTSACGWARCRPPSGVAWTSPECSAGSPRPRLRGRGRIRRRRRGEGAVR